MKFRSSFLIVIILLIASFLLFYRLNDLMIFIGDQAWFYLSARDMLLTGNIPLVGITSSHIWLHQGPLWTYILAVIFAVTNFNPLAPGFFTAGVGVFTVWFVYYVGKKCFSEKFGLVSALLYATSPLVIIHARMPYHTTLIPIISLLWFFAMYQWMKGKSMFFPVILFSLAVLYNFELATLVLWFIFLIVIFYAWYTKKKYFFALKKQRVILASFFAFFVPLVPILLYDMSHGFPQTFRFIAWIGYQLLKVFGLFGGVSNDHTARELIGFVFLFYQRLLYLQNYLIAFLIISASAIWFLYYLFNKYKKRQIKISEALLALTVFVPTVGIIINKTPSEAYLPMLFPFTIFLVAFFFTSFMKTKTTTFFISLLVVFIAFINSYLLVQFNYLLGPNGYGPTFKQRMFATNYIIRESKKKPYELKGIGKGSEFASFTMNTEYLMWWLGNAPVKNADKVFIVGEGFKGVTVLEK